MSFSRCQGLAISTAPELASDAQQGLLVSTRPRYVVLRPNFAEIENSIRQLSARIYSGVCNNYRQFNVDNSCGCSASPPESVDPLSRSLVLILLCQSLFGFHDRLLFLSPPISHRDSRAHSSYVAGQFYLAYAPEYLSLTARLS
jgi:hypothetical protein